MSHPAPALPPDDTTPHANAPAGPAERDPVIGRVIAGRFTVLSRLGAGAMGTVYRAKQARIGREVAIKILRSDRALDENSRARFLREARANSLLTSPNTVTVFDFGSDDDGDFYLAMELLEESRYGQRLRRLGRLDPAAAVETARQALRSLAEAHEKGIIHRDLKPDNLFYSRTRTRETYEETVKVLDFGVAKMLHADGELAMSAVETQAGTVFGTPRYMSPEQAQGRSLDTRSDLYSLGVILYQMLTGRPPFTDDDAVVVMARHIKTPPRPMSEAAPEANVPPELEASVMRALSKEADQRPQTAEAMAAELARAMEAVTLPAGPASSGIRVTVAPAAESAPVTAEHRDVTREAAPLASAPAPSAPLLPFDDSIEVAALRPRRWPMIVGILAAAAAATVSVALLSTRGDEPATATPVVSAPVKIDPGAEAERDRPLATSASASSAGATPPAPPALPLTPTARAAPPSSSASVSSTLAAPARAAPQAPRRQSGRAGSTPPASPTAVGYGYLE